ncbi:hypothetical protein L1049_015898 [Liquidambar formosana]|uniref:KIB1-4 beta-propeller domain-containing protein n=1 Tax=Liquidambar formosana TaxID=63359 RepID=A0AAP0S5F4_LIQFO
MFHVYTNLGEYLSFSQSSIASLLLYKSCNEKRKIDKQTVDGFWHEVPRDIMDLIKRRLNLTDCIRSSIVCKSWRSLLMQKDVRPAPQLPWLLLPHGPQCKHLSFYSLTDGKPRNLKLPKSAQGGRYCGSAKGWLIISEETRLDPKIFLFNPISGAKLQLPSLTTIPSFGEFLDSLPDEYTGSAFMNRVELSSPDTSDCTIAAIFDTWRILAFCKPEDKSWIIFQGRVDDAAENSSFYRDILFSGGTLYALPWSTTSGGVGAAYTVGLENREVTLKVLPALGINDPEFFEVNEDHTDNRIFVEIFISFSLVESTNGELLIIRKFRDPFPSMDANQNQRPDPYRISTFQVYKLDPNNGCMTRLRSLGGQVIFLTDNGSSVLQATDFNGFQGNCIYFAADQPHFCFVADHPPLVCRESGVFYLDDGKFEQSFPSVNLPTHSQMTWFTPNPW